MRRRPHQREDAAAIEADFYENPSVYDILHTPGTAAEVTGLERIAERFATVRGRGGDVWLEPACGTGRYLRVAARRGRRVVGFDASETMIGYARARVPAARLFVAPMESFVGRECPRGSVAVAFNLINSFRHLMSEDAALSHLREIGRALAPGGIYVVGISVTTYGVEQPSEDVWNARRGRTSVTQIVQYEPAVVRDRVERVLSHMIIERPSGATHVDSRYALRAYDSEQWYRLVAAAGLRVAGVVDELGNDADSTALGYRLYVLEVS